MPQEQPAMGPAAILIKNEAHLFCQTNVKTTENVSEVQLV